MKVKIDRVGVCMGDDAIDHRRETEMPDNALSQLGGKWQSYDFEYYCYPDVVERFKQEVREMDNMVYDKEFFN